MGIVCRLITIFIDFFLCQDSYYLEKFIYHLIRLILLITYVLKTTISPGFFIVVNITKVKSRGKLINHKRFQFHQFEYSRQTNSAAADAWYFVLICRENKKHPYFEKKSSIKTSIFDFWTSFRASYIISKPRCCI